MAKKKDEKLNDELENEEVEEETTEEETPKASPATELKDIVIKECNRIIDDYIEICKGNKDTPFIEALDNPDKTKESCVNHIMNNLTKKRIFGGADSLMYEYIHEYYVDNFTDVKDDWSKWMRSPSGTNTESTKKVDEAKIKADALKEAKKQLEAEYGKMDVESIKKQAVAEFKVAEKAKKEEAARKKEEEKKRKEEEAKAKEQAESNNESLGGLFDFL